MSNDKVPATYHPDRGPTPPGIWVDEHARYADAVQAWLLAGCPSDAVPVLVLDPDQPAPDLDPEQNFG